MIEFVRPCVLAEAKTLADSGGLKRAREIELARKFNFKAGSKWAEYDLVC